MELDGWFNRWKIMFRIVKKRMENKEIQTDIITDKSYIFCQFCNDYFIKFEKHLKSGRHLKRFENY